MLFLISCGIFFFSYLFLKLWGFVLFLPFSVSKYNVSTYRLYLTVNKWEISQKFNKKSLILFSHVKKGNR